MAHVAEKSWTTTDLRTCWIQVVKWCFLPGIFESLLCSVFLCWFHFQTGFPPCVYKNGTSSAGLHSTSNITPSGESSPKLIQKKILGSSLIQLGMCLVISNRKSCLQWFKEIGVDVCLISGPEVGSLELTQQLNYVITNLVLSFFLLCHLDNVAFLLSCW